MTRPLPSGPGGTSVPQTLTDFCPGILHAVPAKDGLLMRLRLPGGVIEPATLAAIAELAARHGDGYLDLTARANIQLRGIRPDGLAPLTDGLARAGLLPSAAHERIRNILVSPFAGVDPDELIDLTGLARDLDRAQIADADLARLPAKFAFMLDGGGAGFDPGGNDLSLTAVAPDRLHLSLAGRPTGLGTTPDQAVRLLVDATHALQAVARTHDLPARGRAIVRSPARERWLERLRAFPCPMPRSRPSAPSIGAVAGALLPSVPLGRLTSAQAAALADAAGRFGFDLRLTPWRNLALRGVAAGQVPALRSALAVLGLPLDGTDGFTGLGACAGTAGCAAALADVRHDAQRFARSVAGTPAPTGWSIHFAGCAKRCAMRGGAAVDLIATQSGYDVLFDGKASSVGLAPTEALAAARTVYRLKAP